MVLGTILVLALFVVSGCNTVGAPIDKSSSSSKTTYYFEITDDGSGHNYNRQAYGKTVELIDVGSSGSVIVSVDGVQDSISAGVTKNVNGVKITNKWTYYAEQHNRRAAELYY